MVINIYEINKNRYNKYSNNIKKYSIDNISIQEELPIKEDVYFEEVMLRGIIIGYGTQKEKPDISGVWVNEDEIAIEFFDRGVWLSEEGFEGLGGEWKIQKDKIIMEDLYGNIFEGAFRQDEKGEYIILDGEAYYRERPSK